MISMDFPKGLSHIWDEYQCPGGWEGREARDGGLGLMGEQP